MSNTTSKTYESNPFKVIINGFSDLFQYNQTMSIILLIFSIVGALGQFPFPNFNYRDQSPPALTTPAESTVPVGVGSVMPEPWAIVGIVLLVLGVVAVIIAVATFIGTIYSGMATYTAWKTANKQTVTFGEAFHATIKKFWTIVGTQIIVSLKILGGLLLFIVPGVRAMMRYNMVLFPVFDGDHKASEAIAISKKITKNHLVEVFGMVTAASLIPFVGPLMQLGGGSIMYPQLKHLEASGGPKPKVHWLNYLGFILLGVLFLFVALIAMVLVSLYASAL